MTDVRYMKAGDLVVKDGGDYTFGGTVVAVFQKLSGAWRIAVENPEGLVHIFNAGQLKSAYTTRVRRSVVDYTPHDRTGLGDTRCRPPEDLYGKPIPTATNVDPNTEWATCERCGGSCGCRTEIIPTTFSNEQPVPPIPAGATVMTDRQFEDFVQKAEEQAEEDGSA